MKLLFKLNILVSIILLAAYSSIYISPTAFWLIGFMGMAIPVLMFIQVCYLAYWFYKHKFKRMLLPCILLLIGYSHIQRSISFDFPDDDNKGIKVLSSNVRIFNVYDHLMDIDTSSSKKMIGWLEQSNADVMCLMEYYNEPKHNIFNATNRITKKYKYSYFEKSLVNKVRGSEFGQIIFSKYPIINKGSIKFDKKSHNKSIYCDILWKKDTIRVYNIHLESMHIEERVLFDTTEKNTLTWKVEDTYKRLLGGFEMRAMQIDAVKKHIDSCHYPVIICADLNDLPYSYTYQSLSGNLCNAFEEKGFGFGTTYNGKLPFLRIDNHFYSNALKIKRFEILDDITYSDHYPLQATYDLAEDN